MVLVDVVVEGKLTTQREKSRRAASQSGRRQPQCANPNTALTQTVVDASGRIDETHVNGRLSSRKRTLTREALLADEINTLLGIRVF